MRRGLAAVVVCGVLAGAVPLAQGAPSGASGFVVPIDGELLALFDPPATPYGAGHRGVDIAGSPGAPVRAAGAGVVAFSGQVAGAGWVTVRHGAGLETTYGDLRPRLVRSGDRVRTGEVVGRLAPGARHLDWGARLDGAYIDPLSLLRRWQVHLVGLPRAGGAV